MTTPYPTLSVIAHPPHNLVVHLNHEDHIRRSLSFHLVFCIWNEAEAGRTPESRRTAGVPLMSGESFSSRGDQIIQAWPRTRFCRSGPRSTLAQHLSLVAQVLLYQPSYPLLSLTFLFFEGLTSRMKAWNT